MDNVKTWLKSKLALLVIGFQWGFLILLEWPLMAYARFYDLKNNAPSKKGWLYSLLIGQDHYGNTTLGGHFRTTFSSEIGNQAKVSKTGRAVASFVDKGFEIATGELNHCFNSIEAEDEHRFNTRKALLGFGLSLLGKLFFCGFVIATWEWLV